MKIIRYILLLLILSCSSLSSQINLKFVPTAGIQPNRYDYSMLRNDLVLDFFKIQQALIRVYVDNGFTFLCNVEELAEYAAILKAEFCWRYDFTEREECIEITKDFEKQKLAEDFFNITLNRKTGFEATRLMSKDPSFLHGYFWCKLKNRFESITSNKIEIQNIRYYHKAMSNSFAPRQHYEEERDVFGSHIFEFGKKEDDDYKDLPKWMTPIFFRTAVWRLCETKDTFLDCFDNSRFLNVNVDYMQYPNMSIYLFDHVYTLKKRFRLECISNKMGLMSDFIIKGRENEISTDYDQFRTFTAKYNEVFFKLGDNMQFQYKLDAAFVGTIEKYSWERVNFPLTSDFVVTKHELLFPKTIKLEHDGVYIFTVTSKMLLKVYTFTFRVFVLSPPQIVENFHVPLLLYRLPKQNIEVDIKFMGEGIKVNREINSIPFIDKHSIDNVKSNLSYLSKFTIKYTSTVGKDNEINAGFKIKNVQTLVQIRGQYLSLGFMAENTLGVARFRTLVEVLQKPIWRRTLDEEKKECSSEKDCRFNCEIFQEEYIKKDFKVSYNWRIKSDLKDEILEDGQWNEFLVLERENFLQNQKINIKCRILMVAPIYLSDHRIEYEEIYDSEKDEEVKDKLSIDVSIKNTEEKEATLKESLIISMSCIFFVILICITVVLIVLVFQSHHGEYNVDEQEREIGLDPAQELEDMFEFLDYESDSVSFPKGFKLTIHSKYKPLVENEVLENIHVADIDNDNYSEGSIVDQYI